MLEGPPFFFIIYINAFFFIKLMHVYLGNILFGKNTILVPTFCGHNQFGPYYFQLALNLVPTINSLTENTYVANGLYSWHA